MGTRIRLFVPQNAMIRVATLTMIHRRDDIRLLFLPAARQCHVHTRLILLQIHQLRRQLNLDTVLLEVIAKDGSR